MIPIPYMLGIGALACAISYGAGWLQRHKAALADDVERAITAQVTIVKQNVITEKVVTQYKDRIIYIEGKGTHVKEVIERTAPPADCMWPDYYRRLHDAAARGDNPPDAKRASDTAATLEAAATFETIDANYRTCHANSEQLRSLQDWVSQQAKAGPE